MTHSDGQWEFNEDEWTVEVQGAPIASVYNPDDFPCLDDDERTEALWEESRANGRLLAASPAMKAACEATLLFHSLGPWGEQQRLEWFNLTGMSEATTKNLCEFVRRCIAKTKASADSAASPA